MASYRLHLQTALRGRSWPLTLICQSLTQIFSSLVWGADITKSRIWGQLSMTSANQGSIIGQCDGR